MVPSDNARLFTRRDGIRPLLFESVAVEPCVAKRYNFTLCGNESSLPEDMKRLIADKDRLIARRNGIRPIYFEPALPREL